MKSKTSQHPPAVLLICNHILSFFQRQLNTLAGVALLACVCLIPLAGSSQTNYQYQFDNNLNEASGGPALIENLACGAGPGSFGQVTTVNSSNVCLNFNAYCFNSGGGLQFANSGFISGTYTINMYVRFSSLSNWTRIMDFSNSLYDAGVYIFGGCLNFNPFGQIGPCPAFNPNTFYLFTFVRDAATTTVTVYVNGVLFTTLNDSNGWWFHPINNSLTPINFFRDDNQQSCEAQSGCIAYMSISNTVASAASIATLYSNIPTIIQATVAVPPNVAITPSTVTLNCLTHSTVLTATGGGTYNWSGGSTSSVNLVDSANTYSVTVTDVNGCTATASSVVSKDTIPPTASINPSSATLNCTNLSTVLTASGGTSYNWGGGVTTAAKTVNSPATYTVTVTGANGCTASASASVSQNITPPTAGVNPTTATLTCSTLSATLTASGGASYNWGGGVLTATNTVSIPNTYTVTVTGANGCTATASSTVSQNITPPTASVNPTSATLTCSNLTATLTAGGGGTYNWGGGITTAANTVNAVNTYTVTVTAANGCTATASSSVSQNITPPIAAVTPASAVITCASPTTTLTASGGGTYNWGGGITTATNTVNSASTYTVTVTGANGCTATASSVITQNTTPPVASVSPTSFVLTCSSASTTLTASGGATYNWGGGITTATNTVNSANTYTVTITDANGCTATASSVVTQNITPPTAAISPVSATITCATPSVVLTASGGGTYAWSGGIITATNTVNSPNTYTVTVTSANGCTATASSVITQSVTPPTATITPSAVILTCASPNAVLTAGGGTSYNWGGGIITTTNTVNSPNTYSVTVTDANGCTASATASVTQSNAPPVAAINPSSATLTCSSPSATLTASGGTTYDWGGGITTASTTVNTANTYNVTVTDANGCSSSASVAVTQNTTPPVAAINPSSATLTCSTATVALTASGGGTYDWGGGITTPVNTINSANTYAVTVTGSNGCTATASSVVNQNITPPVASVSPTTATITCSNPTAALTASGGGTYDWGGGITTAANTVSLPNTYTVTVTAANGCTATASSVVSQSITVPPAAISPSSVTLDCNTLSSTLTASGGVSYNWGGGNITNTNNISSPNTYTVTVTDVNGCTATASSVVSQNITPPSASVSPANASLTCVAFSATLTASGGGTYDWGGGVTTAVNTVSTANTYTVTVTGANGCTATASSNVVQNITPPAVSVSPSSATLTCTTLSIALTASGAVTYDWGGGIVTAANTVNLPNTYTVTATGANGCTATASSTVIQDIAAPVATVNPSTATLTCTNPSVTLTAAGGTSYDWGGGVITAAKNVTQPNTYTVTVTGANGCTATASSVVSQNIAQPNVSIAAAATLTCAVLNSTLAGSSTTPNATFDWGGGVTTSSKTVATPGNYSVTVTDPVNGCTASASGNVAQNITPPNITLSNTGILSCLNANVIINAASVTPNVTYDWGGGNTTTSNTVSTAGSYSITVTDPANSCSATASNAVQQNLNPPPVTIAQPAVLNCINASVTLTASSTVVNATYDWGGGNITATNTVTVPASYTVSATDPTNGCTATATATVTQNLTIPNVSIAPPGIITCHSPSITLSASTNAVIPAYNWGAGNTSSTYSVTVAATYSVTVTDNDNGCSATTSTTVTDVPLMSLSETHTNVSCFGFNDGTIDLTVAGGQSPFAYNWSNSAVTEDVNTLVAATYTVVVTDGINCTTSISVPITEPANILVTETHTNVTCNGANNGAINVTVSGGLPPYTYRWNDADLNEDRTGLAPSNYTVTVTYNNTCTTSISATITEPVAISLQPVITNPTCATLGNDGNITVTAAGGTTPYNFLWSNGSSLGTYSNLGPGSYSLTVTDANSCTITDSYTLNYLYDFTVDASPYVSIYLGESTQLSYTLTGTTGNYTSIWSPSYALGCTDCVSPDATPVYSTLYNVTIENQVGCKSFDTVTVRVVPKYDIFIPNVFTPNGDGNNELFQIFGNIHGVEFLQIQIFNRIGEKVFESYNQEFTWDGTYQGVALAPQVFTYQLKLTWINGQKDEVRKGTLTLLK